MSYDYKFRQLTRMFFEILDYKGPTDDEIDEGGNLLFRALYRQHFQGAAEPWSLQGTLDKILAEGGTSEDMRNDIAANYLALAMQCANRELRKLDLEEFKDHGVYCYTAHVAVSERCSEAKQNTPEHKDN